MAIAGVLPAQATRSAERAAPPPPPGGRPSERPIQRIMRAHAAYRATCTYLQA
jgi:hypothetical protein